MSDGVRPKGLPGNHSLPAHNNKEAFNTSPEFSTETSSPQTFGGREVESRSPGEDKTINSTLQQPTITPRSLRKRIIQLIQQIFSLFISRKAHFQAPPPEMADWMGRIFSGELAETSLRECTLLGSHDSASNNLVSPWPLKPLGITQAAGIEKQLEAGVRFLDIRIKPDGHGGYHVHHGIVRGLSARDEVIEPLSHFLKKHPKEAVIVKLQFSKMDRTHVKKYMETEFNPVFDRHLQQNNHNGTPVDPGDISFKSVHETGRNLIVTVSDAHMKEKVAQSDIGDKAWLHHECAFDNWANTPVTDEMLAFNHTKIEEFQKNRAQGDTRLHILQMQTNVQPKRPFRGGLRSLKSLARSANAAAPEALKKWHRTLKFQPNIILQDYVGLFNYEQNLLTTLAFNTLHMHEEEVRKAFPDSWQSILEIRKTLEAETSL